jgi:hypothetical protein
MSDVRLFQRTLNSWMKMNGIKNRHKQLIIKSLHHYPLSIIH